MKTNTSVATSATRRRTMTLRKMNKAISFLPGSISDICKDDTTMVEATLVANDSGLMLNFLGEDFNLSINLAIAKGGRS